MLGFRIIKIYLVFTLLLAFMMLGFEIAKAGDLSSVTASLSVISSLTASNHTITFKITTAGSLKQINLIWGKSPSDSNKPSGLSLVAATLSGSSGLDGNWSMDDSQESNGILKLANGSGQAFNTDDQISVTFSTITNAGLGQCTTEAKMYDNCNIDIVTYSDAGSSAVDNGSITYMIQDDPTLEFTISGVNSGTATNGMTTNISTQYNKIDFGHIVIDDVLYGAQKLKVTTNAANGYSVRAKIDGYLQGLYPANKIDPFAAYNASWSNPVAWESPFGTDANTDTGWIGANTSDTRVPDWNSASAKFGPMSSTKHAVMTSDSPDSGTEAYLTYALEVSVLQPADTYSGIIIYDIVPTY